jgi:hypothetical protein
MEPVLGARTPFAFFAVALAFVFFCSLGGEP